GRYCVIVAQAIKQVRNGMTYESMLAETVAFRGHRGDVGEAYYARPLGAPCPAWCSFIIGHSPTAPDTPRQNSSLKHRKALTFLAFVTHCRRQPATCADSRFRYLGVTSNGMCPKQTCRHGQAAHPDQHRRSKGASKAVRDQRWRLRRVARRRVSQQAQELHRP